MDRYNCNPAIEINSTDATAMKNAKDSRQLQNQSKNDLRNHENSRAQTRTSFGISNGHLKKLMGNPCIYCKVIGICFTNTLNILSTVSSNYEDIHHNIYIRMSHVLILIFVPDGWLYHYMRNKTCAALILNQN